MCSERPEIERYRKGVVIPAYIGHTVVLLDKAFQVKGQGVMDWENGRLRGLDTEISVLEGWYLVHHPEKCNG